MNQASYRSALGATPRRGMRGINSRTQDTGAIIANYGRGVSGVGGINSRTQDTGAILANYARGVNVNMLSGLGSLDWLGQGIALAVIAELTSKATDTDKPDPVQEEVDRLEAARKLHDPFTGAGLVGPGRDNTVYIQSSGMGALGALRGFGSSSARSAASPPFPGASAGGVASLSGAEGALAPASAITTAAISSGSSLASGSTWLAAAGGPIGLAVAGVTVALTMLFKRKGPRQKVATTQVVDSVEPLLVDNLEGYLAGPRTVTSQAQAVANFEAGWQYVVESCDIPEMGTPGKRCVSERGRGGQWDWFRRYLDPILDDPDVRPDPAPGMTYETDPATGEVKQVLAPGNEAMPLLLLAGAAALMLTL